MNAWDSDVNLDPYSSFDWFCRSYYVCSLLIVILAPSTGIKKSKGWDAQETRREIKIEL
jgi:hypothetical protein